MREFVAVDVGPEGERRPATAHLTLRFLGEVPPERNDLLGRLLAGVAHESAPFLLRLEGVGAFPTPARPRVVWVGVTRGGSEVAELARRVQVALANDFGPAPEEFVPHLTLFRVRSVQDRVVAQELLAGARPAPPPRDVLIDRLLLKESVLGPRGAVHRTIADFPLEAAPPTAGR